MIKTFPISIRHAIQSDIPTIKNISSQYSSELGFVRTPSLLDSISRHSLLIAEYNSIVVGFVNYYLRQDHVSTIYEIAVHKEYTGLNIGTFLINAVPHPIQLKCTVDNSANTFYIKQGFSLIEQSLGRKRLLNKYFKPRRLILCKGSSQSVIDVLNDGWIYGIRHTEKPLQQPFFVDINWQNYDWDDYCHKLSQWHPVMALAPDLEHRDQVKGLYAKLRDLKALGVLKIGVCPKFDGATKYLPSWVLTCVSIPSRYAGFVPSREELCGKRVHLLGGSPRRQIEFIKNYPECIVESIDMNYHTNASRFGVIFNGERCRWEKLPDTIKYTYEQKILLNSQSILSYLLSV